MHSVYCEGPLARGLPGSCGIVQVSGLLRELILAMEEAAAEGHSTTGGAMSRMALVIADQIQVHTLPALPVPPDLPRRLAPIRHALGVDPADSRTLKKWAEELGSSARTLARAFERDVGMTFATYRQQMRLHAAIERLARGDTVTQVAYTLGFSSASNFIAAFRKATGITPKAYFAALQRK